MQVLNTVAPVFLIIAAGALLRRFNFMSDAQFSGLNRLTYWVGLPCLLVNKIAGATSANHKAINVFLLMLSVTLTGMLLSWLVALVLRIPRVSASAVVHAGFRGNLAFVGLPIAIYTASSLNSGGQSELTTLAVLSLAPMVVFFNVTSVIVLLLGAHKLGKEGLVRMAGELAINPLLIASVLGLLLLAAGIHLQPALDRTTAAIGQMSLPLALIAIGASLVTVKVRGSVFHALIGALFKVGVLPLLGWLALRLVPLGPAESQIAIIYLSTPTAVASYVLAEQLQGDVATTAGAIVASTLLSVVSLSLAVAFG